jgi:hypothetical protein
MLVEAMTTNEGATREECGAEAEKPDATLLCGAARVAAQAAAGLLESRGREDWITVMRALAELTVTQTEAGDPQPQFSAERLREKCAEADPSGKPYWQGEDETARKKLSTAWDKLQANLAGLDPNLRHRTEKARVPARVETYETRSNADKRSKFYGYRFIPITLPESEPKIKATPEEPARHPRSEIAAIEYMEEMEVYPIPWIRRPIRLNVRGWRAMFMIVPLIVTLIAVVFGAWLLLTFWLSTLPVRTIFQWTVMILSFSGLLTWLVWPLYRLVDRGIIMAPNILQLKTPDYHVLVIRREAEERVIRMLRYTATCPLCKGSVEIQEGHGFHRGRFVGVCNRNAVEHLFSFDHVLCRGKHLFHD